MRFAIGDCKIKSEPLPGAASDFEVRDGNCSEASIPRQFIPGVEKGIQETAPCAGYHRRCFHGPTVAAVPGCSTLRTTMSTERANRSRCWPVAFKTR